MGSDMLQLKHSTMGEDISLSLNSLWKQVLVLQLTRAPLEDAEPESIWIRIQIGSTIICRTTNLVLHTKMKFWNSVFVNISCLKFV